MLRRPSGVTRVVSALVLVGVLLAASCVADDAQTESTPSTPDYAWGEEADLWMDGFHAAVDTYGGGQFARLLAPGASHDYRSMDPAVSFPVQSRRSTLILLASIMLPGAGASVAEGWTLISTDGLVYFNLLDWRPSGRDTIAVTEQPAHLANVFIDMGPEGAQQMVSAISVQSLRDRGSDPNVIAGAMRVAEGWMTAWGQDEARIHADGALMTDSIGLDRVVARSRESTPAGGWQLSTIGGGDAVYPLSFDTNVFDGVVFVVEAVDPEHCPNRLGVVATVDEAERIVREERYWLAAEARRCLNPTDLPDEGWWVGRDLSFTERPVLVEDLETVTATIMVDGHEVEMRHSTPELDRAMEWAFGRFAEAGLTPPRISTITFSDYSPLCADVQGRTRWEGDSWDVYLCFGEDELCRVNCERYQPSPLRTTLHELSHGWMVQNLDDDRRDDFMESLDLESWADPMTPWELQGREHAAENMAWGLLDTNLRMVNIGSPSDDVLASGFRLLAGVDPLPKSSD